LESKAAACSLPQLFVNFLGQEPFNSSSMVTHLMLRIAAGNCSLNGVTEVLPDSENPSLFKAKVVASSVPEKQSPLSDGTRQVKPPY
jgi:hypothetical protein